MIEILRDKIVKRGMDTSCLDVGDVEHSGKRYFQVVKLKQGIETDVAKKLIKIIKER